MIDYTKEWHQHYGLLTYWMLARTHNQEIAEDLASKAFALAWEHRGDLRDPAKFKAWLYQIAMNELRLYWRKDKPQDSLDDVSLKWEDRLRGPDEARQIEARVACAGYLDLIGRLPRAMRKAVRLAAEGWMSREIGRRLQVPAGTVRSRLHYARERLEVYA
jgi:RNA polymerase sigma-70 factor (ECF subfamily)